MTTYVCPECGERNPAGTEFCQYCHAFLAWDEADQAPARPASRGPAAAPPAPRRPEPVRQPEQNVETRMMPRISDLPPDGARPPQQETSPAPVREEESREAPRDPEPRSVRGGGRAERRHGPGDRGGRRLEPPGVQHLRHRRRVHDRGPGCAELAVGRSQRVASAAGRRGRHGGADADHLRGPRARAAKPTRVAGPFPEPGSGAFRTRDLDHHSGRRRPGAPAGRTAAAARTRPRHRRLPVAGRQHAKQPEGPPPVLRLRSRTGRAVPLRSTGAGGRTWRSPARSRSPLGRPARNRDRRSRGP